MQIFKDWGRGFPSLEDYLPSLSCTSPGSTSNILKPNRETKLSKQANKMNSLEKQQNEFIRKRHSSLQKKLRCKKKGGEGEQNKHLPKITVKINSQVMQKSPPAI